MGLNSSADLAEFNVAARRFDLGGSTDIAHLNAAAGGARIQASGDLADNNITAAGRKITLRRSFYVDATTGGHQDHGPLKGCDLNIPPGGMAGEFTGQVSHHDLSARGLELSAGLIRYD